MMNVKMLKALIETSIEGTKALVESEDNVHFTATIISECFNGVSSKVKQQQMVYAVLNPYIASGELHAIAMKTYTPEKWQSLQA